MTMLFALCLMLSPPQAFDVASVKVNNSNTRGSGIPPIRHGQFIAQNVTRIVQDHTGLKGRFDFKLDWTPDELQSKGNEDPNMTSEEGKASIFSAMQEQLGLKLESKRGPVEMLVIDRAAKPAEN